jgi:hypothetical protein
VCNVRILVCNVRILVGDIRFWVCNVRIIHRLMIRFSRRIWKNLTLWFAREFEFLPDQVVSY